MSSSNPIFVKLRDSYRSDRFKLVVSSASATLIQLLVMPLLTRIYPPEAHGFIAPFLSAANLVAVIATLRLEMAVSVEKTTRGLSALLRIIGLTALFCLAGSILIPLVGLPFGYVTQSTYVFFVLAGALGTIRGLQFTLSRLALRVGKTKDLSQNRLLQKGIWSGASVGLGLLSFSPLGLIIGPLFGELTSLRLLFRSPKQLRLALFYSSFSVQSLKVWLKKYKNYPLFSSPHALLSALGSESPIFVLAYAFSEAQLGFFALAFRVSMIPVTFFTKVSAEILFDLLSRAYRVDKPLIPVLANYAKICIPLTLSIFGLVALGVWLFFTSIFGNQWQESISYTLYLLPLAASTFFFSPLSNVANICNQQLNFFLREIIYFVLRVGSIGIGVFYNDIHLAIQLFSVCGSLFIAFNGIWYLNLARRNDQDLKHE